MIEATISNGYIKIDSQQTDNGIFLTLEEGEQLWQTVMNLCHEMRRQEQITKVNN